MRMILSAMMVAAVAALGNAADGTFKLTGENTKIGFTGTKKDGKHTGSFPKLSGTATAPGGKVEAGKIEVVIDMNGLETDAPGLTTHLKNADFFDVKTNPTSKFATTKITKKDDGSYTVTGNFTLNGKTKEITFPAKITTEGGYTLTADFKIDRTDYGIKYGQGKIDNDVPLTVKITAK